MKTEAFVKRLDNDRIVAAIQAAESRSRGEIRVHVASQKVEDAHQAAAEWFGKLGMAGTSERLGVLIYVSPPSSAFAVVGDVGIDERCGPGLWSEVAEQIAHDFRDGRYTDGLVSAVARVGDELARHFPRDQRADVNELPDKVSEGD